MSLTLAARFARRELRGGLGGFRIFLACLALGVAAIAAVGSVRAAIEAGLAREGAALLGGDAEMEFTYRFASDAERAWMAATAARTSEIVDFRSMAVVERDGQANRALTQVKAVDGAYPLIGSVTLTPEMPLSAALAGRDGVPGAVMERVLIDRLGLTPGDRFKLGVQEFVLTAALAREPDGAAAGFSLGPRTIVATPALDASGLLAPGTLYSTKYRLDLPEGADLPALEAAAKARFEASGLRWRDARNGAPGVAEFVRRLGAFLVLVGLSGLAVGGVGVSAAVRAYLADKTQVIATLRTLGADRATIFQTYFLQIGALSVLGIALGLMLGGGLPVLLGPLIGAQLPVPAVFTLYPRPLGEAALYGLLTALIFTLWPLARTEEVRAATLFREALSSAKLLPAPRYLVVIGAALGLLVGLAAWFNGAPRLTLWTAGGIAGALVLLTLAAGLMRRLARRGERAARGRPRAALGAGGHRVATGRRRIGGSVAGAGSVGALGGRADRRQPAQRDHGQPPRGRPLLFLRRHPEGPDARLSRAAGGRPGGLAPGNRADAARGHHEDQRQARARGCRRSLGGARRSGRDLCRPARQDHTDHRRDMVARGVRRPAADQLCRRGGCRDGPVPWRHDDRQRAGP